MNYKFSCILLLVSTFYLCSCADLWHDLRYKNNDIPQGVVIPIVKTPDQKLTKEECLNLLTQKLIMTISMKSLEGIFLKPLAHSEESNKIYVILYQERIIEKGNDYILSVNLKNNIWEACIHNALSGELVLRTVLSFE